MFTIIIGTRDRPALLERALRSVAAQRFEDYELLLIDDSASTATRDANAALLASTVPNGRVVTMRADASGHGPGGVRNVGMAQASRPYLAFLDDDDEWIDPDWLDRAARAIQRAGLDLLFADQVAIRADGVAVAGPVWAEDLAEKLPRNGAEAVDGVYRLSAEQVLLSDGFAHLNTTILKRSLAWEQLGGFDASIRYEEDRDLFLRTIDVAEAIGYLPIVVARHHVPSKRVSASSIADEQKDACRLKVANKVIAGGGREAIRARCRRDRSYVLKRMSVRAAEAGAFGSAIGPARAALQDRFSVKWAAFLASLYVRRAFSKRRQAN